MWNFQILCTQTLQNDAVLFCYTRWCCLFSFYVLSICNIIDGVFMLVLKDISTPY